MLLHVFIVIFVEAFLGTPLQYLILDGLQFGEIGFNPQLNY